MTHLASEAANQGNLSHLWRLQADLASAYANLNRRDEARVAADEALAALDAIAPSIPDAAMRESFLAEAMKQLPATIRRRSTAPRTELLTAREAEIAALVARGLTNSAIADELVLSVRTVETHIANAMSKLGVGSRSQLAAWSVARAHEAAST
jgi:DNA-binding NarL/FixJ family response regulator